MDQFLLFLCVDLFLLNSLVYTHCETWRSTNYMNLQFAQAHKVVMKDDN